jgi:hypothetical protein
MNVFFYYFYFLRGIGLFVLPPVRGIGLFGSQPPKKFRSIAQKFVLANGSLLDHWQTSPKYIERA